jgi:hypothetical protein
MPMTRSLALAALVLCCAPALASAQAPPGPPGPPPGNGTDLPTPPGTAPAFVAPGTAASIPAGPAGPGLLKSAEVSLNRAKRTFSVPFACQAKGTVSITAKPAGRGTLARTGYRCTGGRATARLSLSKKVAAKVVKRKTVAATATVRQGAGSKRISFSLTAGKSAAKAKGFWTDGHLQCSQDGSGAPPAYLAEPDFTTKSPTPVSTRGWVAWYTAAGGWHWLGINGEDRGRWDNWTATASGIAQFHPGGAFEPIPFTWGPVSIPPGQGIYAVGVYEIVYWVGGRPDYQWQYVNAGATGAAAAGAGNLYCAYA